MKKPIEDFVFYDFSKFKGANAHEIIQEFSKHARAQEWDKKVLETVIEDAMSGDNDHLWDVICQHSQTPK
jgi:hypothetical protein